MRKSINPLGCACYLPESLDQKRYECAECHTRYERNSTVHRWYVVWQPETTAEITQAHSARGRANAAEWLSGARFAPTARTAAPVPPRGHTVFHRDPQPRGQAMESALLSLDAAWDHYNEHIRPTLKTEADEVAAMTDEILIGGVVKPADVIIGGGELKPRVVVSDDVFAEIAQTQCDLCDGNHRTTEHLDDERSYEPVDLEKATGANGRSMQEIAADASAAIRQEYEDIAEYHAQMKTTDGYQP